MHTVVNYGPFWIGFLYKQSSCTGVLLRVTGLTKILLNWPVRGKCEALKFGSQISGWEDGYSIGNLSVSCRQAIGTRIPVPWPNIQKYLDTIKFLYKKYLHGVYRPPATTRFTNSDTKAIRAHVRRSSYIRRSRVLLFWAKNGLFPIASVIDQHVF